MAPSGFGLPEKWTTEHDVFICHLDSLDYTIPSIQAMIRQVFPDLSRDVIRASVLDRRLRILDMVGVDYFSREVSEFKWWERLEQPNA